MTALDPHRTLGLSPDASQAEIKRAYRHLAKLYHPDSAGERALPRFLAIQAAYEALVDDPTRPRAQGRGGSAGRPAGPPPPVWQADASRARATREAYRARNRRGSAGPGAGMGAPGGNGSRADPSAPGGSGAGPGRGAGAGRGTEREAGTDAGAGRGSATGAPGRGRSGRSTRRPKATIGSTSYDGADKEPFDPAWEGATWYGAGSGTYWTLNPKEYADPRKHGPEYLARSRRSTGAGRSSRAEPTAGRTAGRTASASDAPAPVTDDPPPPAAEQPSEDPAAGASGFANDALGWTARKGGPARAEDSVDPGPLARPPRSGSRLDHPGETSRRSFGSASGPAPADVASRLASVRGLATSPIGRIALAVLGWLPLGAVLAALTDGLPGCGVGSGTLCADPLRAGIWPIDLLLIGVLAAVPRLAGIAASGAIAFLAVGLISTPVLLVLGGPQTPTANATVLAIVAFVGWLGGIGFALTGRVELPPWRGPRVR